MVEPIPFYGLFEDSSSPETYLREQIHAQQSIINTLSKNVIDLQSEIIKLQGNLDRMALPNLWHAKDFGWEMIKHPDGSFTLRPFPPEEIE